MHKYKHLIEGKLCQIIDQLKNSKITHVKIHSILLNKKHPFYDGYGRICKMLFANNNNKRKLIDWIKIKNLIHKTNLSCIKYSMFTKKYQY